MFDQMRGESVPHDMRAEPRGCYAGFECDLFQQLKKTLARERRGVTAVTRGKKIMREIAFAQHHFAVRQPGFDGFERRFAERYNTFLAAFAFDMHEAAFEL